MWFLILFGVLLKHNVSGHLQYDSKLQNLDKSLLVGSKASVHQFPYQVSLQTQTSTNGSYYVHICSGALLSLKWVITTAYCVTPPGTKIRVVAGLLHREKFDADVQIMDVNTIIIHPDYQKNALLNDIALLKICSSLMFTKSVQPIAPAFSEDTWGAAILSSWKVQTHLLTTYSLKSLYYVVVYILTDDKCRHVLNNNYNLAVNSLCTEEIEEGPFCPGESGSPLIANGYLVGLSSWGPKPCGVLIYSRISSYLDFIMKHVTDL
ncbi:hypothetical protein FQA39_LY12449 [Lamprigera yunnana]|nr:hypothetical protein FQA39_LY12449 [Lamprigera yunnana]